jgi:hypothetical protein
MAAPNASGKIAKRKRDEDEDDVDDEFESRNLVRNTYILLLSLA